MAVALAPAATKTTVKPSTNASEAISTWRREVAAGRVPLHLFERQSGDEGDVAGDQRQDAGGDEREDAGGERRQQRDFL